LRFRHSLIGYNTAQTDSLLDQEASLHQTALEHKQSQLEELLTYQQHLQRQQTIIAQMLQKARSRSDVFESFSEALQQFFGRSEQRNQQEIQHCREAAAQLEAEINHQGEKVESDIIALETFLASVEKHLGDLVDSLGQEFQAGQVLVSDHSDVIQKSALAAEEREQHIDLDKLKWNPDWGTAATTAAVSVQPFSSTVVPVEGPSDEGMQETELSAPEAATEASAQEAAVSAAGFINAPESANPVVEDQTVKAKRRAFTTDDDATILSILKVMLEREGFEVLQAVDGREASKMINTIAPPDIAILDLMLPYVDGLQLTRQIRSKAEWAGTPILILSSNSTENEMVTLLEAGADDYVIKPFNTRELIARVKRLSEAPVN